MKKHLVSILVGMVGLMAGGLLFASAIASSNRSFKPKDGFVPTKEVAIKIAVAVWEPIYGAEKVASQKPYQARLSNDVWFVTGSLPPGVLGGVAQAEISKADGTILSVIHGQ